MQFAPLSRPLEQKVPVRMSKSCLRKISSDLWGFLGFLFLPWTTLMYIAIYPGGIIGFDWILLGLGIFADMAHYFGGYRERERVPYGDQIP